MRQYKLVGVGKNIVTLADVREERLKSEKQVQEYAQKVMELTRQVESQRRTIKRLEENQC